MAENETKKPPPDGSKKDHSLTIGGIAILLVALGGGIKKCGPSALGWAKHEAPVAERLLQSAGGRAVAVRDGVVAAEAAGKTERELRLLPGAKLDDRFRLLSSEAVFRPPSGLPRARLSAPPILPQPSEVPWAESTTSGLISGEHYTPRLFGQAETVRKATILKTNHSGMKDIIRDYLNSRTARTGEGYLLFRYFNPAWIFTSNEK